MTHKNPSRPGRRPGSVSGERQIKDPARAGDSQGITFSTNTHDRKVMKDIWDAEGIQGTDLLRAAVHGFNNRLHWDKTQEQIRYLIENEFGNFIERFGTRAEQERDDLQAKQSMAAQITLLLYKSHLATLHIRQLLDWVGYHPRFVVDDETMQAARGEFSGDWYTLFTTMLKRAETGHGELIELGHKVVDTYYDIDPSMFNIFQDTTPYYNHAVVGVTYEVMERVYEARKKIWASMTPKET